MLNPPSLDGLNTNPLTERKENLTTAEPDLLYNVEELPRSKLMSTCIVSNPPFRCVQLSILALSLTTDLGNRLCSGLNQASNFTPAHEAEILCFWNGSKDNEQRLNQTNRYDCHVAQHRASHFISPAT